MRKFKRFTSGKLRVRVTLNKLLPEDGSIPHPNDACEEELAEAQKVFRRDREAERNRIQRRQDSEYWCCVCFQSRDERERFMLAMGLHPDEKYVDGAAFADKLGIPFEEDNAGFGKWRRDESLSELT